jgi:uncharacterized metal-binding protein YceD (DUF177 family)
VLLFKGDAMNPRPEFDIAFVGLKEGIHEFDFKIERSFFDNFGTSSIDACNIDVKLKFDKKNTFFLLDFQISGTVRLNCNRCNAELDYPIDNDFPVVVKIGEATGDSNTDEDVVYISRSETHLHIEQLVYEFILLTIPAYVVECENIPGHKCNPEVLKILDQLNQEKQKNKEADPRWDSLKNIKFK